jgi:hypothetical protein
MKYQVVWLQSILDVNQAAWDALAQQLKTPFLEWHWLSCLEVSESVGLSTGWIPMHLTLWDKDSLVAAAPLYLKTHGQGEFIVDSFWVELAERLGSFYYPKLVGMSPFTPLEGYRFLIDSQKDAFELTGLLLKEIEIFCKRYGVFSCNFNFVDPDWMPCVEKFGYLTWKHENFTWFNAGLSSFDAYLQLFTSHQRKNIKKECQSMQRQGVNIKIYQGQELPSPLVRTMYDCYVSTNDQYGPWGCKYLNSLFFEQIYHSLGSRILTVVASRKEQQQEQVIGMAFLVYKHDRLYGRYWGNLVPCKDLHFNVCYYKPLQWAIENDIQRFDPGIGGKHKLRRGFRLIPCYSLHRFFDQRLQLVVKSHIEEINVMEQEHMDFINSQLPLR